MASTSTNNYSASYNNTVDTPIECVATPFNVGTHVFDYWELWEGAPYSYITALGTNTNNPLPENIHSEARTAIPHFKERTFNLTVEINNDNWSLYSDLYALLSVTYPGNTTSGGSWPTSVMLNSDPNKTEYDSDWLLYLNGNSFYPNVNMLYQVVSPSSWSCINDGYYMSVYRWYEDIANPSNSHYYQYTNSRLLQFNNTTSSYTYQNIPYGTEVTLNGKDSTVSELDIFPISTVYAGSYYGSRHWFKNLVNSGVTIEEYYTTTITSDTTILANFFG